MACVTLTQAQGIKESYSRDWKYGKYYKSAGRAMEAWGGLHVALGEVVSSEEELVKEIQQEKVKKGIGLVK